MRFLFRWIKRLVLLIIVLVIGLLSPVAYIETMCRPQIVDGGYQPLLPAEWQRPEGRMLLTYPEWHIVHAYADYAAVIRTGDPHEFGFLGSIGGFWSSLCALSAATGDHGGFPWETKQMVYTIGVSFTAELLGKAAYEETVGRVATLIRGPDHAGSDVVSAMQASDYAAFLQQVPWYKWDFRRDALALDALTIADIATFRDHERAFALGIEYRVKAAYAQVIAAAVANVGADQLRLRAVVTGITPERLAALPGVRVVGTRPEGVEIDAARYREFTNLAVQMAAEGGHFVEIAGNDDIMFTAISDSADIPGAIHSFARQGNPGWRHLVVVKVAALADALRATPGVEHIHDY
jgi:hypothetical protein